MTKITRDDFLGHFAGTQIDVNRLDAATLAKMESAGVSVEELRRVAGADGIIQGSREHRLLFQAIDSLERDGSSRYFCTKTDTATGPQPTPAGEVFDAMVGERRRPYSVSIDELVAHFGEGRIDLRGMDAAARQRLGELGMDLRALEKLANDSGHISGTSALRQLFRLIDRLDAGGPAAGFNSTAPLKEGERPESALTSAGEALSILNGAFSHYDQRFTQYGDLSRARTGVEATPVELKVAHMAQTDPKGCYRTAMAMIQRFDRGASSKLDGGNNAYYTAQAESASGELAGWKADFDIVLAYIDRCLDAGRPALVGVSHSKRNINDGKTDHFVVISGRGVDEAGRLYYTYLDSATSGANRQSRLYVDADTSLLFRPPLSSSGFFSKTYQVTQVLAYRDLPLDG